MRIVSTLLAVSVALIALVATDSYAQTGKTLNNAKEKEHVLCGIIRGLPGFSDLDSKNNWTGINVDLCRAVSAAIFGTADNVTFVPLSPKERFIALQSGEIDILSLNTTWTMQRDTNLGIIFAGVNYYDGQGFMVRKDMGITSATQLDGASVCTIQGTTSELNAADYFRENNMQYELLTFEKIDEAVQAYAAGRCDTYTVDASILYSSRLTLPNPQDHIVLPEIISKEPLGPVVRQGDEQWFAIVKWALYAMINAEELGVSSQNVDEMLESDNPKIRRLLGLEGNFGSNLGLNNQWAYNIIKHVGNYSESFENNVGPDTLLEIQRGLNALWTDGGLLYAPPVR